jgi:hypothetical protein
LAAEALESMEGIYFRLGLAQFGWRRKGFGDRLATLFAGETVVGSMSGITGLVTAAVWLAAFAAGRGNGTAAKVTEREDLTENGIPLLQERRE